MKKVYAESWGLLRQGAMAFALMAVILEAMSYFSQSTGSTAGFAGSGAILAFYMHRYFLKGEDYFSRRVMFSRSKYDLSGMFKFVMLAMGLVLLAIFVVFAIIFALVDLEAHTNRWKVQAALAAFFIFWILLGLFGTILPATADRDPRYNLKAGMAKFWVMMLRLVLGPGLATIAVLIIILAILGAQVALGVEANFWVKRLLGVFATFLGLFTLILGVATLCSVYRIIVPSHNPSAY